MLHKEYLICSVFNKLIWYADESLEYITRINKKQEVANWRNIVGDGVNLNLLGSYRVVCDQIFRGVLCTFEALNCSRTFNIFLYMFSRTVWLSPTKVCGIWQIKQYVKMIKESFTASLGRQMLCQVWLMTNDIVVALYCEMPEHSWIWCEDEYMITETYLHSWYIFVLHQVHRDGKRCHSNSKIACKLYKYIYSN